MCKYEDILLSITEEYDKKRKEISKNKIEIISKENQIAIEDLTEEQEEKQLFNIMIDIFVPERNMRSVTIDGTPYLDLFNKKYIIRKPYKKTEWAIYEDNRFIVRIFMKEKNKYKFKVPPTVLNCLNLDLEMESKIKERLEKNTYCHFYASYDETVKLLDDFNSLGQTKRNNIFQWFLNIAIDSLPIIKKIS